MDDARKLDLAQAEHEGWCAFEDGRSIDSAPFLEDEARRRWRFGWNNAASKTARPHPRDRMVNDPILTYPPAAPTKGGTSPNDIVKQAMARIPVPNLHLFPPRLVTHDELAEEIDATIKAVSNTIAEFTTKLEARIAALEAQMASLTPPEPPTKAAVMARALTNHR
jgi:hypothetical protein